ncbi:MAG: CPXCG motif-containing cysteine-rich protein [Planctomycetota bacterium]|jgi:hypothetical protein|nr:CPXCG motif-containing cysteine-rich protein [Planctomycetota bacterium]
MSDDEDEVVVSCPHCGADTVIDLASIAPTEEPIVDCMVCCRPSRVRHSDGDVELISEE